MVLGGGIIETDKLVHRLKQSQLNQRRDYLSHYREGIVPTVFSWLIALPRLNKDKNFDQADFYRECNLIRVSDLEMIAIGGPLTGFMEQSDHERVVADMRLANGLPWSIPITLSVEFDRSPSRKAAGYA